MFATIDECLGAEADVLVSEGLEPARDVARSLHGLESPAALGGVRTTLCCFLAQVADDIAACVEMDDKGAGARAANMCGLLLKLLTPENPTPARRQS